MRFDDLEKAYKLLPEVTEAERKLRMAQELKTLNVLHGMSRELADYDPPSNIGVAFRKIKAALVELHEKELAGLNGALSALGVDTTTR